jgi:hypothetical protein
LALGVKHGRFGHEAVLMANGKVLIIGGTTGNVTTDVEVYDPSGNHGSGVSTDLKGLNKARDVSYVSWGYMAFTATLLPSGKVLVVGGSGYGDQANSVELYDPSGVGSSTTLTPLNHANRYTHKSVLLSSGKVMVIGGTCPWDQSFNSKSVELYDPSGGGASTDLADLPVTRHYDFNAIVLENDRVLIGGLESSAILDTYDPNAKGGAGGVLSSGNAISVARYGHTDTLLPDGCVLMTGGFGTNGEAIDSVQVFKPEKNQMESLVSLTDKIAGHSATLLSNGKVLLAGGSGNRGATNHVVLYDPTGSGSLVSLGDLQVKRSFHQASLLPNGKLLISGGVDGRQRPSQSGTIISSSKPKAGPIFWELGVEA